MDLEIITILETSYLFYMYFIFKTNYSFNSAIFNTQVQDLGLFFVHDSDIYENKICGFGKLMAIIAIILAFIRLNLIKNNDDKKSLFYRTIVFCSICIVLAFTMNMNAFVYILPIVVCELYVASSTWH